MIGYTRKVGLRKSRLHFLRTGSWPVDLELITDFDEVEVAPGVTVAAERKIREDIDKAMATVGEMPAFRHDCVCGGCDPDDGPLDALVERQEQKRRERGEPRSCCHTTGPNHHPACQEQPMRIENGQRYADASGRLFEGDTDGGLWELAAGYILAGEVWELDGLRPVRVVDQ